MTKPRARLQPENSSALPFRRLDIALLLGLIAVTLAVFWPATGYDFINLDDPTFVTSNPHVLGGLTWPNVAWAFQPGPGDYWHPLTWLSLMLDVTLCGTGPAALHRTNILFHAANAALLFLAVRQLTGQRWPAAFVAALFAWHPLRVQSVAWVTERKDMLSTFFWMLAMWAYAAYAGMARREKPPGTTARRWIFYTLSLVFFACGLMSKAMVITLPCVLLLLDYWPLNRVTFRSAAATLPALGRLIREKLPFFLLSAVSGIVTYGTERERKVVITVADTSVVARIQDILGAYERYLAKLFWPVDLAAYYSRPDQWRGTETLFAAVLIGGLCAGAIWLGRKRPFVFVGWFWFLGTLVPVIGVTRGFGEFMADRFTYIPSIGLGLAVVWAMAEFFSAKFPAKQWVAGAAGGLVLAALVARTRNQLPYWRNSETLFEHDIALNRNDPFAHSQLGAYFSSRGRMQEALEHFHIAQRLAPEASAISANFGVIMAARGMMPEAIANYLQALKFDPNNAEVWYDLANAEAAQGDWEHAIESYQRALHIYPEYPEAHNNLGNALAAAGRPEEAIAEFQAAVRSYSGFAAAHKNLGNAWLRAGEIPEAIEQYRDLVRLTPDAFGAHISLGDALAAAGNTNAAVAEYRRAAELNPALVTDRVQLDEHLARRARDAQAVEQLRTARRAHPEDPAAHFQLAAGLARLGQTDDAIAELRATLRLNPDFPGARDALQSLTESKGSH